MSEGSGDGAEPWGVQGSETNSDTNDETTMTDYTDLIDSIASDPDRHGVEIETGILFNNDSDDPNATVHTAETALMRRLLNHPHFDLDWYVTTDDGATVHVQSEQFAEEGHDGRKPVYAVSGQLPIGCLKISAKPRKNAGNAQVITSTVLGE